MPWPEVPLTLAEGTAEVRLRQLALVSAFEEALMWGALNLEPVGTISQGMLPRADALGDLGTRTLKTELVMGSTRASATKSLWVWLWSVPRCQVGTLAE